MKKKLREVSLFKERILSLLRDIAGYGLHYYDT